MLDEAIIKIRKRVKAAQRNYNRNLTTIEKILIQERGYASRPPENEDVVVLYSGGLDSSIMLDLIIQEWNVKVHPIFFKRGARAEKFEEAAFDYFVKFYSERYPNNIGDATKVVYEIPPKNFKETFPKELSLTVGLPLRNSTMENLAVMYAVSLNGKYNLNIKTILTGAIADDETDPENSMLSLRSQTLNTCINTGDWSWQITSPLTDRVFREEPVSKANLIFYARDRGLPLEKTRSCFSPDEIADGTCFACKKRLAAFEATGIKDPVEYRKVRQ